MTPKIDYVMLGQALAAYVERGYKHVEVPWAVAEQHVRATLPEWADPFVLGLRGDGDDGKLYYAGTESHLVGSAEQAFLSMDLPPNMYVGVTPCWRNEPVRNLFYQIGFMKIELFDNRPGANVESVVWDAKVVMREFLAECPREVETEEGIDLMVGSIEVGSYGERELPDYGRWVYGTGLALPRFSVADGLAKVL